MNHLVSIRTNIFYNKVDKKYEKQFEVILLVDKPEYIRTNDSEIIRNRGIEELRFVTHKQGIEGLIQALIKLKDIKEEELS